MLFNLKNNNDKIVKELIISVNSLIKFHKNINIIIYVELNPNYNIELIPKSIKKYVKIINFSDKYKFDNCDRNDYYLGFPGQAGIMGLNELLLFINSPFEHTLYLDCDTKILNPIDNIINNYKDEIYFTYDNWWVNKNNKVINEQINNKSINGGFVLFKNTENNKLQFQEVINLIYTNPYMSDQNAMTKIFQKNKNIKYLDNRYYNFRCLNKCNLPGTDDVIICHSHGKY
jgi:hypothetical protein